MIKLSRIVMVVAAMTISIGASAIDKVVKKGTSADQLAKVLSGDLFSISCNGLNLNFNNQDVTWTAGATNFKFKKEDPQALDGEDYTGKIVLHLYENGNPRDFWGHKEHYLNFNPTNGAFFALSNNNRNGTDGKNGAVWIVEEATGGLTFKNMANNNYISSTGQSATAVVCVIPEAIGYDAGEVNTAYDLVKNETMQASIKTALTQAHDAYASDASAANLEAYGNAVNAAIESAEKFGLNVGDDATKYIPNPDFRSSDLSGWNLNGKATPAIDVANHDCEFFEKDFNMSLTIPGMKKGTYEISMQAFQRPGAPNNDLATNFENNNWTSCATLYTTAQETPVKHICEEWQDARVYTTDGWQTDSEVTPAGGTKHYIPNSMAGGREWFDANYYITTAKAVVSEDGGSLTFGFRGQQPAGSWILFDNFTLRYFSEDVLVDASESEKIIAKAAAYGKMGAEAKTALDAAIAALEADKTNGALYKAAQDACDAAESSIAYYAIVAPYAAKYAALNAAGQAAVSSPANAILGTDYVNGTLNEAGFPDAAAMIKEHAIIPLIKGTIAHGGGANVDLTSFIVNAECNQSVSGGWEGDLRWANGQQYTGAPDNTYFDAWDGKERTFNMHQTIKLPAGIYQLKAATRAAAENSTGDIYFTEDKNGENHHTDINKDGNTGGKLGNGWSWTIVDGIVLANDKEVNIGFYTTVNDSWSGADDFHLTYLGDASATMTIIAEAQYGTFCAPFDVVLPTGVTAYSAEVNGEYATLTEVATEGQTITAGTPVILNSDAAVNETFYGKSTVNETTCESGNLVGILSEQTVPADGATYYALQLVDGAAEFCTIVANDYTLKQNRCYLKVAGATPANIRIAFGEETGIKNIETASDAPMYNVAGVRVNNNYKGIVIKGGKKFINK